FVVFSTCHLPSSTPFPYTTLFRSQTVYANVHAAIKGKSGINKSKHGIGGAVESDVTGPLSSTSLYLAYAYHFQFNRKWMMSAGRSEEHTSELQSRENLVCRLLLEK